MKKPKTIRGKVNRAIKIAREINVSTPKLLSGYPVNSKGYPAIYPIAHDIALHGDGTAHVDDAQEIKSWFNEDVINPPFKSINTAEEGFVYAGHVSDIEPDNIKREIVNVAILFFLSGMFVGAFVVYLCILLH